MARSIVPFLMFDGKAEEAMRFYISVFEGSEITRIDRYGPDEQGLEGSVLSAEFVLAGQRFVCVDAAVKHEFSFTPAMSIAVECESEAELEAAFARLVQGGSVLMPIDSYGFSTKFAWLKDRFGVSWQLNLP